MIRALALLAVAAVAAKAACAAGVTSAAELPDSPACHQALSALEARETALRGTPGAPPADAAWLGLRRAAARACLGADAEAAPPPARGVRAPIEIAPLGAAGLPATSAPRPSMSASPSPLRYTQVCDASGCWLKGIDPEASPNDVLRGLPLRCRWVGGLVDCR